MTSNKKKQVLIVEDDLDIREALAQVLEFEGYDVAVAGNGREALDYLKKSKRPSLILLDLMMPVMDGVQFSTEQHRDPSLAKIPVVVLSADNQGQRKASTIQAAAYLRKPVDLDELLSAVETNCAN